LAFVCNVAAAIAILCFASMQVEARPQYNTAWLKKYDAVAKANDVKDKVKCAVCHPGKDKKDRNAYGKAVGAALGKKMEKDPKAIEAAFVKAEGEKSESEGKTFGDLLKDKKLPAKVEPAK
jgi:hypothetical protein